MKRCALVFLAFIIYFPVFASNPNSEFVITKKSNNLEIQTILDEIQNVEISHLIEKISNKNKVIILDVNFKKIREEYVDENEDLNNQTMLVPIIYRCQFIAKVYNVSYYMLQKN